MRTPEQVVEAVRFVAQQLELHGYKCLPCAACHRSTLIGVNGLHAALTELLALYEDTPDAAGMQAPPRQTEQDQAKGRGSAE